MLSDFQVGQLVKSKAGHDKGDVLLVVSVLDDHYVMVVDGERRKIDKPKKKKGIHLKSLKVIDHDLKQLLETNQPINDALIRRKIKDNLNGSE